MTVKELKTKLERFPDDMNVKISCDMLIRDIDDVGRIIDIDTNETSVYIYDKYEPRIAMYENRV